MLIGVPKEIKANENRVALTPAGAQALKDNGHQVMVEVNSGEGSGFSNQSYEEVGAKLLADPKEIYDKADMIMKVKEPQPSEYDLMKEGQLLFTFLHLAAEPEVTEALLKNKVTGIAYETVETPDGSLPLLSPMSEVAGRMATQNGCRYLEKINGGKGVLMGGVPGTMPAKVTVIGGGIVGTNAAKIALGMGSDVTILDISIPRLRYLDDLFYNRLKTLMSNSFNIEQCVKDSDLVISAVLVPGAKAPNLVTENMVKEMEAGSVIVDVAVDQGGAVETVDQITTHADPTYKSHGVIHYAVANMPGAVPRTSTMALTNVTLPYAIKLANKGWKQAVKEDDMLVKGLNTVDGKLVYEPVAKSLELDYTPIEDVL